MEKKLIMRCVYVQSIDEYIAAFEDGYRDIHYAGFSRDGLISTLQRRGENSLEYQYQYGKELYFAGEDEKAHKIYQELVEKGFEFAKIGLSADAAKGIGGPANPALAFRLLKDLDGKEYGMAYHNLGYCYYNGIGTKEDVAKAKLNPDVAGMDVVHIVFEKVNAKIKCLSFVPDGNYVKVGDTIAAYEGSTRALLVGERVALNFLQHMCGIATVAYRYTKLVEGTKARVIDTRKTTPGLRILEKYAIRVGGAANHRFGLDDGILIKDNHIEAAGGITEAINAARAGAPHTLRIEVEVVDLDGLREAIDAGAEAVMLDNMNCDTMREAVKIADGRVILEASGGITEANVAEVAATGVDLISSGALTHSVKALDISLNIKAIK